jgi:glycosyltransferase involved in cell wall biosynthesis
MIFSPGPTILPSRIVPVAVTIHDAMPAKLPASIIPKSPLARASNWISAKWSQKIFTDSENSKRDLVETYDLQPEKVSVIYLGYNASIYKPSKHDSPTEGRLMDVHGVRRPYILHHGMVQQRKNLVRLIKAYRAYISKRKNYGIQLVLAGGFGWGSDEIRMEAQKKSGYSGIIFTGPLQDSELAGLIRGASLCVIPSLYEGFCLPLVEAMACGAPTIASNSSCIPEVSGQILRYFDPFSIEEIATRIEQALEDTSLREELRQRGLKRASEFSWKRCAQETLHALMAHAT